MAGFFFASLIFSEICILGVFSVSLQQPEQVHLAYGESPTEMTVTWVTFESTHGMSIVEYGKWNLNTVAKGNVTIFKDSTIRYIHRVTLTNLTPGQRYMYHCGSPYGWSPLFYFTAMPASPDWSPRLAVYGDMGNVNAQSIGRLQNEALKGNYDAVLHVGDFAYNMDTDGGKVGDAFMNQIEQIAAYVPYMTCVGNHENAYNFSNYKARFSMPKAGGDGLNMFYSFKMGPAYIISISTEFYFYIQYGWAQIYRQYEWLEKELQEANKPENRAKHPWLITMGHKPMYCSNNDKDDCTHYESVIRTGLPGIKAYGLEDMFYNYGVDLMFWAHEHSYERLWPLYNRTVCNGSMAEPYTNPPAPVHIITGSAGCYSKHDPFKPVKPYWSAYRNLDYGYTMMKVINSTHLTLEQVSDDKDGSVVDKVMIIKESHGAGTYTCHEQIKKAGFKDQFKLVYDQDVKIRRQA